jgi:hypothetical protein
MQIDKIAWDSMQDHAELHLQSLEPWVQVLFKTYFYWFSPIHKPQATNWSFWIFSFWPHSLVLDIKPFMCFHPTTYEFGWFVQYIVPKAVWPCSIEFKRYCTLFLRIHIVFLIKVKLHKKVGWASAVSTLQVQAHTLQKMHFGYKTIHVHLINNWSLLLSSFMTRHFTWPTWLVWVINMPKFYISISFFTQFTAWVNRNLKIWNSILVLFLCS